MKAPTTLLLEQNDIDHRWKVVDIADNVFGDGKTIKDAIESARLVTDKPIYHYDSNKLYINDAKEDKDLYTLDELLDELSRFAGMSVIKVIGRELKTIGYQMEVRE